MSSSRIPTPGPPRSAASTARSSRSSSMRRLGRPVSESSSGHPGVVHRRALEVLRCGVHRAVQHEPQQQEPEGRGERDRAYRLGLGLGGGRVVERDLGRADQVTARADRQVDAQHGRGLADLALRRTRDVGLDPRGRLAEDRRGLESCRVGEARVRGRGGVVQHHAVHGPQPQADQPATEPVHGLADALFGGVVDHADPVRVDRHLWRDPVRERLGGGDTLLERLLAQHLGGGEHDADGHHRDPDQRDEHEATRERHASATEGGATPGPAHRCPPWAAGGRPRAGRRSWRASRTDQDRVSPTVG